MDEASDSGNGKRGQTLEERLAAVPPGRNLPVVLVHGYNFFAENDGTQWASLVDAFRAWGWTSEIGDWSYYCADAAGRFSADGHGDHETHFAEPGHACHDYNTRIEHLGYHLAWTIYDEFNVRGICADIIAHSMGGLVARYAIGGIGTPDFPPFLCVRAVVTLGTPHLGQTNCGADNQSCVQMQYGSAFITNLAVAPQGLGGTKWILMGSDGDNTVSSDSSLGVAAQVLIRFENVDDINHAVGKNYMNAFWREGMGLAFKDDDAPYYEADDRTAFAFWFDGNDWVQSKEAPWPVRWADLEMSSASGFAPPVFLPYPGDAIRVLPEEADLVAAKGQSASFSAACRDPEATLAGLSWQSLGGNDFEEIDFDAVQLWADPWQSSIDVTIPASTKIRAVCQYTTGSEKAITWTIEVAGSAGSEGDTLASDEAAALEAGTVMYHTFSLVEGLRVTFSFGVTDASKVDAAIIRHRDLDRFLDGEQVWACGYTEQASSGGATCDEAADEYDFVLYCRNTTFDCDLEYSLYTHA